MQNRWSDADSRALVEQYAQQPGCNEDVALRVYTSRLIGREPSLVLHGGGNTSVKTTLRDDLGHAVEVLCVKGSGWDLGDIEPEGLPAVRLDSIQALRELDRLSDEAMVNAQRTRMLDASGPNPSVETLLHAFLPHKFIDHSHADAILALADQAEGERLVGEVFGGRLGVVPYVMPGFELARLAAEVYEAGPGVEGLVLLQHGLFTFGATARESYERHVRAVSEAEQHVALRPARATADRTLPDLSYADLAPILRGRLGEGERRYVLELRSGPEIRAFVDDPKLADLSQRGVATPDHVIRTKNLPLLLEPGPLADAERAGAHIEERLAAYREAYGAYVRRQIEAKGSDKTPLDPDPRIVLVPGLGLIAAGPHAKAAGIAADLYEHTVPVIRDAEAIGRYRALPEGDLFDMEYWSLEQAKLGKKAAPALEGQVVLVTGAAGGIGAATARGFAEAGAELFLVDREEAPLAAMAEELGAGWRVLDVTDEQAVAGSVEAAVRRFGGIDGAVSNAGIAPQGRMHALGSEELRRSFEVNFFAHQSVASAVTRVLRAQGMGGFLLFNASKSAFNPGPEFGPYTLPKSAVVTLMKQYAVENGDAGIRTGAVNADRIRTGLLNANDIAARARARGLEPDDYYRANLLGREVLAEDVADAFLWLAQARSTTGCVLTVDGGNIAASPR
ncbi:MAG: bifunctional aldolase/short-chain dehydrogenase [Deltaproteobacteria bacterium]|jgi:rhamnose utilization protein RhaD (predicted bifunctional aldolase and dehydrogenase)/NAD(P)-dependent dehydrogenase (short-subunit alcohol dehydrogenase family)|nr:bifunctional aldolase/short-chain dehydrogenase [Deltaproteobacteria bacterium]